MNVRSILMSLVDLVFPPRGNAVIVEQLTKVQLVKRSRRVVTPPIISIFSYKDPLIRSLIWELKYKKNGRVAQLFAEVLYDEVVNVSAGAPFLIIPMPCSHQRLKERGYNQCELLTSELKLLISPLHFSIDHNLLLKWKDTPRQTLGNRALRLSNIKGCFKVSNSDSIKGKNIILIDDVVTTQSTMKEATASLYSAGAGRVIGLAIARS